MRKAVCIGPQASAVPGQEHCGAETKCPVHGKARRKFFTIRGGEVVAIDRSLPIAR